MPSPVALLWLNAAPRLHDQELLQAAAAQGMSPVLLLTLEGPLFSPPLDSSRTSESLPALSLRATKIRAAAGHLAESVAELGGRLLVFRAEFDDVLPQLARHLNVAAVYAYRGIDPADRKRDQRLESLCRDLGMEYRPFWPNFLLNPADLPYLPEHQPDSLDEFRVRTARFSVVRPPLPAPKGLLKAEGLENFRHLALVPENELAEWAASDPFSETEALQELENYFAENGPSEQYGNARQGLGIATETSGLGVYLANGLLSSRRFFLEMERHSTRDARSDTFAQLLERLHERDHLRLMHLKHAEALRQPSGLLPVGIQWSHAPELLEAWKLGQTGIPIIDACMRQLGQTGRLPHRGRLLAAHFLTKNLGLDWRQGEAWMARTLLDYEPSSNLLHWIQVAGLFERRRFGFNYLHPLFQAEKYDPEGLYVRRWVPELAALGPAKIHFPWLVPAEKRAAKGIRLGETYPLPVVDIEESLQRNEVMYKRAFQAAGLNYGKPLIRKFVPTHREKAKRRR